MESEYIGNVILYVGAAIAALGGSSIGIGAICKWLKKAVSAVVEKLLSTKTDYDKEASKLANVAKKIDTTGDKMMQVGSVLETYGEELCKMKEKTEASAERLDAVAQALSIMIKQNEYMVANGTAKECAKLLDGAKETVNMERIGQDE